MKKLIENDTLKVVNIITFTEFIITAILGVLSIQQKRIDILCVFALGVGLVIDAYLMGRADQKESQIRFIAHGILTPLLIPFCAYSANVEDSGMPIFWAIAVVLMVLGVIQGTTVHLERVSYGNLSRYTMSKDNSLFSKIVSGILSFGLMVPLLAGGIFSIIKNSDPLVLIGALCMLIFSAIGPALKQFELLFVYSMIGEALMILMFTISFII